MSERPKFVTEAVREARRNRRIPEGSACACCGETNPLLLQAATGELIEVALLEFHHVLGAANDSKAGGFLCANHHRVATELQRQVGVTLVRDPPRHELERIEAMLRSAAAFLRQLADAFIRAADYIAAFVGVSDRETPAWRTLPVTNH